MPHARRDNVEIYYETMGEASGVPLVLLEGTGAQLIGWREEFCRMLVAQGFHVIRMDNRDVGLSQKFGGPEDIDGGYELSDMAEDVTRVLDDLGLASAHIAGRSMGGMMAQMLAIEHPERVRSLALLYSTPGKDRRWVLHGELPALQAVQPRISREEAIEFAALIERPTAPGPYAWDEAWTREAAATAYDRCYAPDGVPRQWAALMRAPERLERLRAVTAPTVLLHGREDPVLSWRASADMAEVIVGAELHVYPGMGHGLPRELWPEMVQAITRTALRGEKPLV
ncbi:alpha/beta fold hydrolase [Salinibacterium sp. SYSU T00001]|uniref:alpha/beta fold hydrolase n=1 Tax=Homoserinimonas sedimenticola TaxID=2986805 RepID=UPI002235D304|nr:alpha/beta hydrolase [Salinibacterium sedimenticola]MCW4385361.1 alpha/beta fold hydrolase [Salinibacterium sedimenticola]